MNFSEKLTALLSLTGAKNAQLADALHIGRPYVSRLRTGERKLPAKPKLLRGMAAYFASRCGDDYRIRALSELTADPRLNAYADESVITEVLYDWFQGITAESNAPAGRFLSSFGLYAPKAAWEDSGAENAILRDAHGMAAYYGSAGRRKALRDMFAYVDSLKRPVTVLLFTDEDTSWVVDDAAYGRWLANELRQQTAAGMQYERIQPPFTSVEETFSAIERWLPGYMAGAVRQYYYPWARDQLHRRTIFVVPGEVVLYGDSVFGEREPPLTLLTRDAGIAEVCLEKYKAIKKLCRPAILTYTSASENLFACAEEVAAIEDAGVYKTDVLSVNTLPHSIRERIRSVGTPFAKRLGESFERRAKSRASVLRRHPIMDIMRLPAVANVLSGKEPIPGTQSLPGGPLYYTPAEYRAHLDNILWHLETYPNYSAVFTEDASFGSVTVFAKGDSRALLVKTTPPFSVFDVTERSMASAFCDYLRRIAEERMTPGARRATVALLDDEIQRLDRMQ
mgnify:CR=1 FL=1